MISLQTDDDEPLNKEISGHDKKKEEGEGKERERKWSVPSSSKNAFIFAIRERQVLKFIF